MKKGLICIDLIRIMKDMLYLCIERMFGLTYGCRILQRIFCRLATMILVRSTDEARDHLEEREDLPSIIVA
jgi:hypothetical protein